MNELDDSAPINGSAIQVNSNDLPDLEIYGYQVYEKLSEHPEREQITYLARDINLARLVVIKQWRRSDCHTITSDYANYLPEIERLQQLDHPNIPRYLNSFATPTGFCVVREYLSGVSLAEIGELPGSDLKLVADAIFELLSYLHQQTPVVIHQNIKPENIIVNTETKLRIYLVDFGINPHDADATTGTPGFMPPEQRLDLGITSTADIYSLGVSLICLLTGTATPQAQYLFDDNYRPQFRHLIPANTAPQLLIWLETMVAPNPEQRLNAVRVDIASELEERSTANQLLEPELNLAFNPPAPPQKVRWVQWGIAAGILFSLGLILHQFLFPDGGEISPAQIARNQSIARAAEFASSDRGRLIREKRCISCNLDRQNFAKAELTGAIVPQSSLNGTNFANANLTLAIFSDADLSGANLSGANLQRAAFYGANLSGTNLVGANLTQAKLVYAKLKDARLRDANFSNAELRFAEFQQVDLTKTNFTGADLSNADLSYTNLRQAILTGAKLDGANLTGATMPDGSIHP